MSRKKLIAANWKMHKTIAESRAFGEALKGQIGGLPDCDLLIFPPFLSLPSLAEVLEGAKVSLGAQDLYWEKKGAYTGEVSADMIIDAGGTSVLVGHSERRHDIGEGNEIVAKKLGAALSAGLQPVLCVGEKLSKREAGQAESFVKSQIDASLSELDAADAARVVVAYEPVWAIGTGKTASPDDADEMHRFIRSCVDDRFGQGLASEIRILYGGSVKPNNAESLLHREDIDGALIGGASLEVDSYVGITQAVP